MTYTEQGMPNFPLPLSRDGAVVLTCAGLPFCRLEDFDDQRLLPRWPGYSIGNNHLTKSAQLIVDAVNCHADLIAALKECERRATAQQPGDGHFGIAGIARAALARVPKGRT